MLNIFRKDFLLGIGLGFLLSALIVNLSGMEKLTDSEIIERASQLGMEHRDSIEESGGERVEKPVENAGLSSVEDTDKNTGQTVETSPDDKLPIIKFVIRPGSGSEEIARKLEEQEIVADRNEFYRLVTEKNVHHRFRTGTFELPAGGDMEEILEILTGK